MPTERLVEATERTVSPAERRLCLLQDSAQRLQVKEEFNDFEIIIDEEAKMITGLINKRKATL